MLKFLALLLLSVLPVDTTARDQCSHFARNFFYDEYGKLVFVQLIAYDGEHVFFWRLCKEESPMIPVRSGTGWVLRWDEGGIMREVWAQSYDDEFHSQYDPETFDRTLLPVEQRRRLKGAK